MSEIITVVILEDNEKDKQEIVSLITNHYPDMQIIGTADTIATGKRLIEKTMPKVIISDIVLLDGHAYDLFDQNIYPACLVYMSVHSEYIPNAIKTSPFDYLEKPVKYSDFERLYTRMNVAFDFRKDYVRNFGKTKIFSDLVEGKVVIGNNYNNKLYHIDELIFIKAVGNYCNVYLENGTIEMHTKSLKDVTAILNKYGFFRVHRSFTINLKYVRKVDISVGAIFFDRYGWQVPTSFKYTEDIQNILESMKLK